METLDYMDGNGKGNREGIAIEICYHYQEETDLLKPNRMQLT